MVPRRLHSSRNLFANKLHLALTRDEVTDAYLKAVHEVIDASGIGLYELDSELGQMVSVKATVTNRLLDDYESYGRTADPVLDYIALNRRPIDSSRLDEVKWQSSGAKHAIGESGFVHSMQAPIIVGGMAFGTVNFARKSDQPPFDSDDLVSARIVSEHLGLAIERSLRFELTSHRASKIERAADRVPQPMVVTDLEGAVLFRNKAARDSWNQALTLEGIPIEPDAISTAIADAVAMIRSEGKRVVTQRVTTSADHAVIVKTLRLPEDENSAVSLFYEVSSGASERRLPTWEVLSRREQDIANLVSEGLTTKQIAQRAFISENTVKQHLKRVFAKTNVSNRAELVQLIWHTSSDSADSEITH